MIGYRVKLCLSFIDWLFPLLQIFCMALCLELGFEWLLDDSIRHSPSLKPQQRVGAYTYLMVADITPSLRSGFCTLF